MNVSVPQYPRALARKMALDMRYFSEIDADLHQAAHANIDAYLTELGINFEGKQLPVSLRPTVLTLDEVRSTSEDLAVVRICLNKLLTQLVSDIKVSSSSSRLLSFFSFYRPWFELIAGEVRHADHIMLMRYDAATSSEGIFKVMEPNGACPGGVIHCAYIRDAWRRSQLGEHILEGSEVVEFESDSPDSFLHLLFSVARCEREPTIALCNYKGVFSNELKSLVNRNELLRQQGVTSGNVIVCDIRDIRVHEDAAYVGEIQIDVVYNKIDHMMVDPSDADIAGWREASKLESCEFLNSIAALYIAEAKSIFAALCDPELQVELGFDQHELTAIARRVPRTRMLIGHKESPSYEDLVRNRMDYVIKADALTRGAGVYVGRLESENSWGAALMHLAVSNAVVQDVLDIPSRETVHFSTDLENSLTVRREFHGVDFFFYGGDFGGVVDLRPNSPPVFERVLGFLLWDQTLNRRKLEFSGSDHDGWLVAPPGLCRAIGTLYPMDE
ncbi:putative circularly permuted ATP-grasp superfamily protein [Rhizobium soli]|uniref:Putative circularly permuted ATP-grasp superfamily protein n=1 Tax=Rhizobium soli TaxID=424798 RepID=A0A7X0JP36_9HYPH|nr:hypothetical protein [Rhizobium soli]MBB6510549.1 putative circularly permuted ATP-grasp superfamily protein [Rhizobium soli]